MKKFTVIVLLMFALSFAAGAQNAVDSTYAVQPAVDSTLTGKNIFKVLSGKTNTSREGKIEIDQPQSVSSAMSRHISRNASKKMTGYRIRIFFDNKQNARIMSEKVAGGFKAQHPGVGVYREYENPYFKVTVGDFRTKEDAKRFLNSIKAQYPSGFIVRERINFPIM